LRQLQETLKITTILVTHDQREAMALADSIVVMGEGRIQQQGRPAEIYRAPANRFVANFIGLSNLLPVEVLDSHTVRLGERLLEVACTSAQPAGGAAVLSIRPEAIQLASTAAPCEGGNVVCARVTSIRDMGSNMEVHLDCEGRRLLSVVQPREWIGIGAGELAQVRLPKEQCRVLAA
jgi:putative spermidine/putrescine transport system ATP-binding protein